MITLVKPIQLRGPRVFLPDVVKNWVTRVVAHGGATPSGGTQLAFAAFYKALSDNNLLPKMKVVMPMAPDSLTACLTPFLNPALGADPWINHSFVSGDLTVNGLIGNGSTKYLDTGVVPRGAFANNADGGLTVYAAANGNNNTETDLYCSNAPSQTMGTNVSQGGTAICDMYTQTPGSGRISASNSAFVGYVSGNRGALGGGVLQAIYKANSSGGHSTLVSSTTSSGGSLPTLNLFAFADNNVGSPILLSSKRCSFFAIHSGLTALDSSNFYTAIQALRTALGGGFV
jgi:hypothetical protein